VVRVDRHKWTFERFSIPIFDALFFDVGDRAVTAQELGGIGAVRTGEALINATFFAIAVPVANPIGPSGVRELTLTMPIRGRPQRNQLDGVSGECYEFSWGSQALRSKQQYPTRQLSAERHLAAPE
jgi:hypothetical protein